MFKLALGNNIAFLVTGWEETGEITPVPHLAIAVPSSKSTDHTLVTLVISQHPNHANLPSNLFLHKHTILSKQDEFSPSYISEEHKYDITESVRATIRHTMETDDGC